MSFTYEDMSSDQFEDVAIALCHDVLGPAVQGFAEGKDGGRDAKFVGTAQELPSQRHPWTGTVIVQAKHTNGLNKRFTDSDFFNPKAPKAESTVLGQELVRIKRLVDSGQVDHYMLFSNRRLTGNGQAEIEAYISENTGLEVSSIHIVGVEQMERWFRAYPGAAARVDVSPFEAPLIVDPRELGDVVESLSKSFKDFGPDIPPAKRVGFDQKNQLNGMSDEYATLLKRRYLKDCGIVQAFLADPENQDVLEAYNAAAEEFELKIVAKRRDYDSFDDVMNYLWDVLFARDSMLRSNRRLTRLVVFYMYWNCDIGMEPEGISDSTMGAVDA